MRTNSPKFFGISGTLIAGLITFIASIRIDNPILYSLVFLAFLFSPAFSCIAGGLKDYRIATMIAIYTLIGALFIGMTRPGVAIAPSRQKVYRAERQLSGDIGAYREVLGGCAFAIGRILFIRKKRESVTDNTIIAG